MYLKVERLAIAALASIGLAATAAPALGDAQRGITVEVNSRITMVPNSPAFHGRVKARKHACVEDRTVKLFKRRHDNKRLLGIDETNDRGRWKEIVNPLRPGRYFAVVTRETVGAADAIYVCERDKSQVARIVVE
jgi:hypothetical protein